MGGQSSSESSVEYINENFKRNDTGTKSKKAPKNIQCLQCNRKFHKQNDLATHVAMSHQKHFSSDMDGTFAPPLASTARGNLSDELDLANGTQSDSLSRNLKRKSHRNIEKKILCDMCDARLGTENGLYLHKTTYHKAKYVF